MNRTTIRLAGGIVSCLLIACRPAAERTLEETIDRRYPVEPGATLSVTNRDGSIRIYGGGTREVWIVATKKAYQAERLKAISVKVSAQPNSITVETIYPPETRPDFLDRSGTVDYVIVVPQTMRSSNLELGTGEVQVEEMRGSETKVQLKNGRIYANNCFANLDLHLDTGNLAIAYHWWEDVVFSVRSMVEDGPTSAYIPSVAVFRLIAQTATGKIGNDFQEKERRRPEPENKIDMVVGGDAKTLFQLETRNGNITISAHNP